MFLEPRPYLNGAPTFRPRLFWPRTNVQIFRTFTVILFGHIEMF